MAVENILQRNAIEVQSVSLGEVVLSAPISPEMREKLSAEFEAVGFELIGDRRSQLIENIKRETMTYARAESGLSHLRLSDFLQERLHLDYHYLSDLFSAVEGQTLEKFFIAHQGTSCLQRTPAFRHCRAPGLFLYSLSEHTVQETNRTYAHAFQATHVAASPCTR